MIAARPTVARHAAQSSARALPTVRMPTSSSALWPIPPGSPLAARRMSTTSGLSSGISTSGRVSSDLKVDHLGTQRRSSLALYSAARLLGGSINIRAYTASKHGPTIPSTRTPQTTRHFSGTASSLVSATHPGNPHDFELPPSRATAHSTEAGSDTAEESVRQKRAIDNRAAPPPDGVVALGEDVGVSGLVARERYARDGNDEEVKRTDEDERHGRSGPDRPKLPTSIKKLNRLLSRQTLGDVPEHELKETFVRGSGPGGQAINKTSSSVSLIHLPTGLRVQAQPTRSREQNRKAARRIMAEKLDMMIATGLWTRSKPMNRGVEEREGREGERAGAGASGDTMSQGVGSGSTAVAIGEGGEPLKRQDEVMGLDGADDKVMQRQGAAAFDMAGVDSANQAENRTGKAMGETRDEKAKSDKAKRKEAKKAAEMDLASKWSKKEIQWEKMRIRKANSAKKTKKKKRGREKGGVDGGDEGDGLVQDGAERGKAAEGD